MKFNSEICFIIVVYASLVLRWFYVINRFHKQMLNFDASYSEHKDHPIFKGMLFARAVSLSVVAPVLSFVKPSYLNTFFDGVIVNAKEKVSVGRVAKQTK